MTTTFSRTLFILFFSLISTAAVLAQTKNSKPKVNQLGYYPQAPKLGITPQTDLSSFYLKDAESGAVVYEGELSDDDYYSPGDESVKVADFSEYFVPGTYILGIVDGEESYPFTIGNNVFSELTDGIIKAMYFNRASMELEEAYAGEWARALGHPDDEVLVHNSAASTGRPANSIISSSKGWYDAGDFNKYVVPISSSISQMLFAYEEFPEFFDDRSLNIPESTNDIPDILDENLWALRWLFTMQDPEDGGVYHKLTSPTFQGTVMPNVPTADRYVVMKGTAATYDFAAVMAHAARVYEPFLPDFADSALAAAEDAWDWALDNPNVSYNQGALTNPAISTGTYGDGSFGDEKFWAASELYITTKDDSYYMDNGWSSSGVVGWNSVRGMGLFSLVANRTELTAVGLSDTTSMKQKVASIADSYINSGNTSAYRSPFGTASGHFFWGSNGFAGNIGLVTMLAYRVTGEEEYYDATIHVLDYIMGRNPLDQSFVTGFGENPPMNIHHRQSEADNVVDPVPGWVAGGANPNNQSQDCGTSAYTYTNPALSYLDHYCSYSTNEMTTYWNSPFVYLLAGLEHLTEAFSLEDTKTGFFRSPNFSPYFEPGDTVSLSWKLFNIDNFSLSYRLLSEEEFTVLESNLTADDSVYSAFIVPDLRGESIVFRLQDLDDEEVWVQSPSLKISPNRSLVIDEIWVSGEFNPGKRVSIYWISVSVETLNLYARLGTEVEFELVGEDIAAADGFYNRFWVPEAPGDSFVLRLEDAETDTVFAETDPIPIVALVNTEDPSRIAEFSLAQNFPNPFNPTTSISFELDKPGKAVLSVYSLMGQMVATLVNEVKSAGTHSISWNAAGFSSGVYYYQLQLGDRVLTRKMTLIK
ncbi:MAG: T9SS C-terminal target domain-containing protein [Balneola sp.]|nr:MAG: T9SS C-terminal target domain-containing protein [Balneola sp.]